MISPTHARQKLATKAGRNIGTPYYAVGIEVPPRRGSSFSMRYTGVSSARAGRTFLRRRLLRKRVGMVGALYLFSEDGRHSVELLTSVRRPNRRIESGADRSAKTSRLLRARRNGRR